MININADISRRVFIKASAAAGLGTIVVSQASCDKKDVDFYVATITGSLEQLKPLLPSQSALLLKAISVAKEVNQAYQDGKFDSSLALANNLTTVINEIIAAAGVNLSDSVKVIISITNVAMSAVAVLIKGSTPQGTTSRMASPVASKMRALSDSTRITLIFEATRL